MYKILYPEHYFVRLQKNCLTDELSEAESGLLKKFFKGYNNGSRQQTRQMQPTRKLADDLLHYYVS